MVACMIGELKLDVAGPGSGPGLAWPVDCEQQGLQRPRSFRDASVRALHILVHYCMGRHLLYWSHLLQHTAVPPLKVSSRIEPLAPGVLLALGVCHRETSVFIAGPGVYIHGNPTYTSTRAHTPNSQLLLS